MTDIPDDLYEGVSVDINFDAPGPLFGDLFMICGFENPNFPPPGNYAFDTIEDLQFSQIDDYFGVESQDDDGDDVIVWLFPLVGGECVFHNPGPFEGLRLQYNVLRNPNRHVDHFLRCVSSVAALSSQPQPDTDAIRSRINTITEHWQTHGVVVGSDDALQIDF
jgi:hypothetical protein